MCVNLEEHTFAEPWVIALDPTGPSGHADRETAGGGPAAF
jgi:hypothetical protein